MPVIVRGMDDVVTFLENFERRMGASIYNVITKYGMDLYRSVLYMSPVDTGRFRGDWGFDVNTSGNAIIEFTIFNRLPYAGPVAYGSVVGQQPWPTAGPKTVVNQGRVFSTQAPEGVVEPAIDSLPIDKLLKEIMKALG